MSIISTLRTIIIAGINVVFLLLSALGVTPIVDKTLTQINVTGNLSGYMKVLRRFMYVLNGTVWNKWYWISLLIGYIVCSLLELIKSIIQNLDDGLDGIKSATNAIGDAANAAKDGASQAANAAKDGASQAANAAKDGASQAANAAKDGASQTANAAKDGASQTAKDGAVKFTGKQDEDVKLADEVVGSDDEEIKDDEIDHYIEKFSNDSDGIGPYETFDDLPF